MGGSALAELGGLGITCSGHVMSKKQNSMNVLPLPQVAQLTSVLQPIISVRRGKVLGFEALCRHRGLSNMRSPSFLFEQAEHEGWRVNLEHACIEHACSAFVTARNEHPNSLLFLNVDAHVVASHEAYFDELAAIIAAKGVSPKRVVLEVSEAVVETIEPLMDFCERAKSHGFLIALDDVGTAHANFERLLAVRPTVLKLDFSLISGLSHDSWKREVVGGLVLLAQRIGALILAEGAEEHADVLTALELGVDIFQGFYFAKPCGDPQRIKEIESRVASLRKEFTAQTLAVAQATQARREWMFQSAHKLSSQILLAPAETREQLIRSELERNTEIECVYSLNPQGIQISLTYHTRALDDEETPLFQPAVIGADHSLKPYCVPIIAGAHHFISEPYLSWATGNTCVTVCLRVLNTRDHFLLCVDFKADGGGRMVPRQLSA